jgi:hypothetical protein
MAANDLDLIDFLSAHPTYTLDEAASELARRKPMAVNGEVADETTDPVLADVVPAIEGRRIS